MEAIGGLISFKADGTSLLAKGNFTYSLGKPKREAVMGVQGVDGYKETPQVPYVEGEISLNSETSISDIQDMVDVTVELDLGSISGGQTKSIVFSNAYYAGEGKAETEEGKFGIRFEAASAEEA